MRRCKDSGRRSSNSPPELNQRRDEVSQDMLAPTTLRQKNTMDELHDHLQRSRLFACLSDAQTQRVVRESAIRQLPAKSPIGLPSTETQYVHFMLRGRAKVCYLTRDGKQPILYFVNPDELIGEQSILNGRNGDDYVETIESSLAASIPTRLLRDLMLSEPTFATSLSELISRRRTQVEHRVRHLLFLSNRERLTHLLLDLAEQYGLVTGDSLELQIKLSHQDLANFIGSTRETVTVVLGKMQLDGLLNVRRRRITLLDTRALAQSVDRKVPTTPGA